ncbi:uncharacterized protein BJ171DRAFT_62854 [Polychytrium aggregatum]|uniref:uncharacterized protein n=1 Tax=Polychytrium aggregatum TaxID=110093 RepID=UPI0022FDC221|nr:uncharacterized protein BJ171DRAFT_62854 [Polychytrium aggregatum]KAI9205560.1 hypothetical protein BJ171DRAFT_62854 [Polychytrium aggregatum]
MSNATSPVVPIDPSNIQWFIHHSSSRLAPQCATTSTSAAATVSNLGDYVLALNRCSCFAATSTTTSSCQYSAILTGNNTILSYDCGKDITCSKNCTLISSYPTTSNDPCTSNYVTGQYSVFDYTSTSTWDAGFKTKYFSYYTFSTNDATCAAANTANRTPVYPTCTQILPGVYGLTILNPTSGQLEFYGCGDSACNTCQLASAVNPSKACSVDATDSDTYFTTYRAGAILSDSTITLPSTFPNQTKPTTGPTPSSTPSPSDNGGSNAGLIGGIVAGVVVLVAAVGGFIWFRRSKSISSQSKPQGPPAAPHTEVVKPVPPPVFEGNPQLDYGLPASQVAYSQPAYSRPAYGQPAYSQPAYSQPTYSQPTYSQPTYSQGSASYAQDPRASFAPVYPPGSSQPYAQSSTGYAASSASNEKAGISGYSSGTPQHYGGYQVPAPAPAQSSGYSGSVGTATSHGQSQTAVKHVAVAAFDTKNPQQINLHLGDVILVQLPFVDGFAQGFNQSTGLSGLVPQNSLRVMGENYTSAPAAAAGDSLPSYAP